MQEPHKGSPQESDRNQTCFNAAGTCYEYYRMRYECCLTNIVSKLYSKMPFVCAQPVTIQGHRKT